MRGFRLRTIWAGAAIVLVACGSRQSADTTPTTVSSAGADVVEGGEAPAATALPAEIEKVEPIVEIDQELSEKPPRRDVRITSYEEAMARPIELGDATLDGGEMQLSGEQVADVMDEHLDELYETCIRKELERGNELGTVIIDLAIRGWDGMVLGATVEPGRRRFKKCIVGYLEDMRFPAFASPRMGARYRFHAG